MNQTTSQRLKYTWDIVTERNLTVNQLKAIDEVSQMISFGGEVKQIKEKLSQLK